MQEPREGATQEERTQWLASLSPDEDLIVQTPVGHRTQLILISVFKRTLLQDDLEPHHRLELLEFLDGLCVSPAAIAAVEPASSAFLAVVTEALRVDPADMAPGFAILDRLETFRILAAMNSSLLTAIRLGRRR